MRLLASPYLRPSIRIYLCKKFPVFYGTRMLITVFTRARHRSVFWDRCIQSTYSQSIFLSPQLWVPSHTPKKSWELRRTDFCFRRNTREEKVSGQPTGQAWKGFRKSTDLFGNNRKFNFMYKNVFRQWRRWYRQGTWDPSTLGLHPTIEQERANSNKIHFDNFSHLRLGLPSGLLL
jgi:hypothetical protein